MFTFSMRWILGDFHKDFYAFVFPGLCALILVPIAATNNLDAFMQLLGIIALVFSDSGHVYTTVWRTYLSKEERQRRPFYFWLPLFLFPLFFFWSLKGWSYLWPFVVYATVFHNVRQFFGISKWYQRLNGRFSKVSDWFLYSLCFLPFIAFHFRDTHKWNYYAKAEIFRFPNETLLLTFQIFYLSVISIWIVYELRLWRSGKQEFNRILSVTTPALLYGVGFLVGQSLESVIFPLVIAHGIGYLILISHSMTRSQLAWHNNYLKAVIAVMTTALIFGVLNELIEEDSNVLNFSLQNVSPIEAFWVAVVLTPLFFHYVVDAIIWRRGHPDSGAIYKI